MPNNLPIPPFWTGNPQTPIYLDTSNGREQICPTCGLNSKDHPIHCISTASPAPPSYRSTTSLATSSERLANPPSYESTASPAATSKKSTVPVLRLETPLRWYRPQPPLPALRFDVQSKEQGRARARARRVAFSPLSPVTRIQEDDGRRSFTSGSSIPNTPVDDNKTTKKTNFGLGIAEVPFHTEASTIRSRGSERLGKAEEGESFKKSLSQNIEGIEHRLWKNSTSGNVAKHWRLETLSLLLAALCMCAIIIMLFLMQNKPVPVWPMSITLNAYIAILSRTASASLMLPVSEAIGQLKWIWFQGRSRKMRDFELFDNASRGPWGSLMLIARTKGTRLAALGAAITIFVMAMDPFFQQVVHYPSVTTLHLQNGSVPRAVYYEPHFTTLLDSQKNPAFKPSQLIDATIEPFFLDYGTKEFKVGNATRPEIPVTCPTSDCTWEPYETLGVCSQCTDVVDMLEFDCITTWLDWVSNSTPIIWPDNSTTCGWFFNATSDYRTISDRPTLMQGYQVDPFTKEPSGEILTTRLTPLVSNRKRFSTWGGSINFKDVRHILTNFVVVSTAEETDEEGMLRSVLQHKKPRALECNLAWCVKTMESSFHSGSYTERVKSHFINTTAESYPWKNVPNPTPEHPDQSMMVYRGNITISPPAQTDQGIAPSYGASNFTAVNIIVVLDDYLPSYVTYDRNGSQIGLRYLTWRDNAYTRPFPKNPWSAPNNITDHVEKLAMALTNIIRQSSDVQALGKAYYQETYIRIRWVWLTFPITVLVLTMIFLLGTVIRTSMEEDRVGVWKNSAIATLLYGLPDAAQEKITALQGHGTPRSKAKVLNVRMLPTKGWRVSGLSPLMRKPQPPPGWI